MKEEIKDKTWYEEVKEDFIKNINDTYTLNLAIRILEDRKELLAENLDLQSQLKAKEEVEKEFIKYLEAEKDRLAREVSQIYEDSLGKTKLVNEDIFNEINNVLSKYKEILSKGENKWKIKDL